MMDPQTLQMILALRGNDSLGQQQSVDQGSVVLVPGGNPLISPATIANRDNNFATKSEFDFLQHDPLFVGDAIRHRAQRNIENIPQNADRPIIPGEWGPSSTGQGTFGGGINWVRRI
jgi:hypothetical protein